MSTKNLDVSLIYFFRSLSVPIARFGLFVIFFWFGLLKVIGLSPASELVRSLFEKTIPFVSFDLFLIAFGVFECVIGILFLIKGVERIVIPMLFLHMVTTLGPLFLVPEATWSGFLVPTLEGQYIIKNLVIIAAAVVIASHLDPLKRLK